MGPHSHDSMCVYVSLNKASWKGNTACTMETEVAMERMLFRKQQKKQGLDSSLTVIYLKKKNLTIEIIDIRVVPEKHHYEQSDPAHAQRSILAMALQQSALLCNSRAAHYPFPHPTLQSAPFKSACDVCPLTHVRAGAT